MDLSKEAIEKIEQLSETKELTINERKYTSKQIYKVEVPRAKQIDCRNLSSIVDYIKENRDVLTEKELIIHIETHDTVKLISKLSANWRERETYLVASVKGYGSEHIFGKQYDQENFIISLQANFVNDYNIKNLLSFVGSVKNGAVQEFNDDGVTQQVAVKAGVQLVKKSEVPNPVELQPFRTFCEIEQPESKFILRVFNNDKPTFALFEADGNKWKHDAIIAIKKYFTEALPEIAVIA